ncbi:MAG: hypothetical protein CVT77_04555 [Alphaproteobacteria bacterium HGW-Alphaproteobacteria-16]|nr:MAG: hypothetical protein CVT77_04555 [Alphaproteobacteria bacterium HGW-Alphaproteobacteria-16]
MSQPVSSAPPSLSERLRERFGPRAVAVVLALLVELLLALLLLTLAPRMMDREEETVPMSTFDVAAETKKAVEEPAPKAPSAAAQPVERVTPQPATAPAPQPDTAPPADPPPRMLDIPLSRMPDISTLPRQPAGPPAPRRVAGPPAPGPATGDSQRVDGSGPNGEPLYAASWFREPYDSELTGYLSSARGPGWGMIACRTIADYRVDRCAIVAEYPEGSNIARAVLAAAWQFRVRPPRIGGRPQVGEWVRIRIDYEMRPSRAAP